MEKAGVIPLDLSLSLKPFYVTKTMTDLLEDIRKIDDVRGKLSLLNESLQKHKEELAPIEGRVFNGEFPHSVLLLKESINILQEEIRKIKNEESESGRPSTEVLPFYTNKGTKCDEEQAEILGNNVGEVKAKASSTAFLVNPNHEIDNPPPCKYSAKARGKAGATKRPGLSFDPFVTRVPRTEHGRHRRSLNSNENDQTLKNRPKPLSGSTLNNNRRKWTQELHAKFVEALNFLGGHEVATPKHIRQVMQMEGLTNDQVKSHLQTALQNTSITGHFNLSLNAAEQLESLSIPKSNEYGDARGSKTSGSSE